MIKTKRLVIRPVGEGDLGRLTELLQDENIHKYMERMPYPYSMKDAREFLESSKEKKDGRDFMITFDGEVVGGIAIMKVFRGRAEIGYWLGKPYWGRGIVTEAVNGLLRHFSGKIDLFTAHVAVPNVASQRVLEKNGFKRIAVVRRYHRNFVGEVNDACIYVKDLK
jgi:[ribosomal protein S5]-alanine N-acetyltransferase